MSDKTLFDLDDIGPLQSDDVLLIARQGLIADNSTTVEALKDYVVSSQEISDKVGSEAFNEAIEAIGREKVSKEPGKGLSSSDYTQEEKTKLLLLPTREELDEEFSGIQSQLEFDDSPTAGSNNPVTSDGIHKALGYKYAKPESGIPKSDMAEDVQESLDKADSAVQFEADVNPDSAEMQSEYRRVLEPLYQALSDAQTVTDDASRAVARAEAASSRADGSATVASQEASQASVAAASARAAAAVADTAAQQGKGNYGSLAERLNAIEAGKQNTINDIATIRENATNAAHLSERVSAIENMISEDSAGVIDTFEEIVGFLRGIEDSNTLDGIIKGLSASISGRYVKPNEGIPLSDMDITIQSQLSKAASAVQFEAETDVADVDLLNEYERLLAKLYQALLDAQQVKNDVADVKASAYNAALQARQAGDTANFYAASARDAAVNAANKASEAQDAAQLALLSMDAAKGDYSSLSERLMAIVQVLQGKYAKPESGIPKSDMAEDVQESLGKADSAYRLPYGGVPKSDMSAVVQESLGKADSAVQFQDITGWLKVEANADPCSLVSLLN